MQVSTDFDLKILVVDDEVISQMSIKLLLETLGHKVVTAYNGSDALNKLNEQTFSLILTDINMPVMDGIQFTKILRNSRNGKENIPIVAITSHLASAEHEKAKSAGINNIYTKPVDVSMLKTILNSHTNS